jgi:AcrR family transcriptional regulator
MTNRAATRQIILEAAIRCIERYGLDRVTTRRIAQEAGTNLASINYHFRTKEQLIEETLSVTIEHMLEDVLQALAVTDRPFDATLREVFRYLITGSRKFPGLSKAHLSQAVLERRPNSVGARAMMRIFNGLLARAGRAYPRRKPDWLRLRLAQVMDSIMFTVLAPHFFGAQTRRRKLTEAQSVALANSYADLFLCGL